MALIYSLLPLLIILMDNFSHCYLIRRGGSIDRVHRRTLADWRNAYNYYGRAPDDDDIRPKQSLKSKRLCLRLNTCKKTKKIMDENVGANFEIQNVLAEMDSLVRPRFGR